MANRDFANCYTYLLRARTHRLRPQEQMPRLTKRMLLLMSGRSHPSGGARQQPPTLKVSSRRCTARKARTGRLPKVRRC